jgi:hypothetical protein
MLGAIGFCIDNLHDNIKCYYQDFALFVEDVNIKPEVNVLYYLNTWLSYHSHVISRLWLQDWIFNFH